MRRILFMFLFLSLACNYSNSKTKNVSSKGDTTFSTEKWKKGNPYDRGRMVNNLMNREILNNLTTDSLVLLLGNPLEKSRSFYTYLIKRDTNLLNNYLLFYVQIDTANYKVVDYWITD